MNQVKVDFTLTIVEEGFPPIGVETLNGELQDNGMIRLDNTPFFAEEVALGDMLRCKKLANKKRYLFEEVVEESGSKALSIIFLNDDCKEDVYQFLKKKGCYCEYGEFKAFNMLAVEILEKIEYEEVESFLEEQELKGVLSFAELCI